MHLCFAAGLAFLVDSPLLRCLELRQSRHCLLLAKRPVVYHFWRIRNSFQKVAK